MESLWFMCLLFWIFCATATANKGNTPPPSNACGKGWLFGDIEGWIYDDGTCHDLNGHQKKVDIYQGCVCGFWSASACGMNPHNRGEMVTIHVSKTGTEARTFTEEQHVTSYICYRH